MIGLHAHKYTHIRALAHTHQVINENFLKPLLCAMVDGLSAEPRVAANVSWVGARGGSWWLVVALRVFRRVCMVV